MNKFAILAAVAALVAAPAFAEEKHESKTVEKSKTEAGITKTEKETTVKVKDDGSSKTTVETKAVNDPKGAMNKETAKTKEEIEKDAAGNVTKHTKDGKADVAPAAGEKKNY